MKEVYTSDAYRAAVDYRKRLGWSPIPLKIRSKAPKLPKDHPFLGRRATDEEFAGFDFRDNVGIVAGRVSGFIVLDDDADGEALRENGWHVPATPTVKTKRGHQYYFRCPEEGFPTFDVAGKLEVRGDGAYVAAPPSIHPSGAVYEWAISPDEAELADPPAWLLKQAALRGRRMRAEDVGETIPNGERNKTLFRLACALRRPGLDEDSIAAALRGINETKCKPPLDEDEVRRIAHSAARYDAAGEARARSVPEEPTSNGHRRQGAPRRTLTDLGNAERFVDDHGERVRYCAPWKKWLVYDGKRWAPDDTGETQRMMKATVRGIYAEATEAEDSQERKAIADHAKRSESAVRLADALRLACSEPGIPILPRQLDADPWLLNAENGTIDLKAGELREHRREDLITKLAPVDYDPDANAPIFEAMLVRILPTEALRRFVQRAIGYAASGTVSEEFLVILYGVGANGKSTLVNVVMDALGDYAMQAAPDLLLAKHGAHPTELADLFGARFVASVETDEGRRFAEGLVKQLTGRDPIKARRMREDFWQFDPTHTIFLATNHKPEVRGTDHAIWRRLKLVPFGVAIPEAEQDKKLPEKLRAELPGILAWIVGGCVSYQRDGLCEPGEVRTATEGYRSEMDVLAAFIEDLCVVHPKAEVPATPLYQAYNDWCAENGESSGSQRRFGGRLRERGFESFTYTAGPNRDRKGWRGIGLRNDRHDDDPGGPSSPPESSASADDQSRASDEKRDQGIHNASESGADDRQQAESLIGKGESRNQTDDADERGPFSNIDGINTPHKGAIQKEGPHRQNRPHSAVTPRERPRPRRRLTPEEAERVQHLVSEGMSPKFARAEVLGKEP